MKESEEQLYELAEKLIDWINEQQITAPAAISVLVGVLSFTGKHIKLTKEQFTKLLNQALKDYDEPK